MEPIRVISLVRHAGRREAFARRNGHVPFTFFDAIDGRALTIDEVRATGAFTREVEATYDAHGYGCGLSHWHLWKEAAAGTQPLTIAEDDVLFRHDFADRFTQVLESMPEGWDMVLWGWNFDSALQVRPLGDVSPAVILFDQRQLRNALDVFQALRDPVQPLRMERAFGLPAYTLSPKGAARMLQLCFPQKPLAVMIPMKSELLVNVGVDVSANAAYPKAGAYVCFPPLAVTPNRRGDAG